MKLDESILEQLDLEAASVKEPVNVMRVDEALDFLKECAERLQNKSEQYVTTKDADVKVDCIDIITARLNNFTQAFKDIVIFLRQEEGTYKRGQRKPDSLRYCIVSYDTFDFRQTEMLRKGQINSGL